MPICPPAAVDLLVPCGIGIPAHDRAELNGLTTVFGGGLSRVPISTPKAQTGNVAAGSGIDAAAAVLARASQQASPPPSTPESRPAASAERQRRGRGMATCNVAVSSVYSLGGQNAALVFKKS